MFTGSRAFVRDHPWMKDVRMAISMDTAVAGPISTCKAGQDNGVLIQAMARTYTNAAWTSFGNRDSRNLDGFYDPIHGNGSMNGSYLVQLVHGE